MTYLYIYIKMKIKKKSEKITYFIELLTTPVSFLDEGENRTVA